VCYHLYSKVNVDSQSQFSVVIHATLRSMEFFRFILPNSVENLDSPDYHELSWLFHLICEVKYNFLRVFQSRDLIGQICQEYVLALNSHVITSNTVSVELYATLVEEVEKDGGNREEVVKMCGNAICSMTDLLKIEFDEYEDCKYNLVFHHTFVFQAFLNFR